MSTKEKGQSRMITRGLGRQQRPSLLVGLLLVPHSFFKQIQADSTIYWLRARRFPRPVRVSALPTPCEASRSCNGFSGLPRGLSAKSISYSCGFSHEKRLDTERRRYCHALANPLPQEVGRLAPHGLRFLRKAESLRVCRITGRVHYAFGRHAPWAFDR